MTQRQSNSEDSGVAGAMKGNRPKTTLRRAYEASLEEIWDLWTTKTGLESWWGPEGFTVKVVTLDLRPEGDLLYAMTATGPAQLEFMKRAGMPPTTEARLTYREVSPLKRLAYVHRVDFIPGVEAYDVATVVDFLSEANQVQLALHLDAMHSAEWTRRSLDGWESQLAKADRLFHRK